MDSSYNVSPRHDLDYSLLDGSGEEEATLNQENQNRKQHRINNSNYIPLDTIERLETNISLDADGTNEPTELNDKMYTSKPQPKISRNRCSQWMTKPTSVLVLYLATSLAIAVLIINVILLVFATQTDHDNRHGHNSVYEGSCKKASILSTIWHIMINMLSTLLLGASNFTMQMLVAPTREDIDHAHSQGKQLNIGTPSIYNLRFISRLRRTLFCLLCLSSIPLHLFYNSAVYIVTSASTFDVLIVYEEFLNTTAPYPSEYSVYNISDSDLQIHARSQTPWKKLTLTECASIYNQPFLRGYSTLLRVADESQRNRSQDASLNITKGFIDTWLYQAHNVEDYLALGSHNTIQSPDYNCSKSLGDDFVYHIDVQRSNHNTVQSTTFTFPTAYCLAQPVQDHCQIKFSPTILIIVVMLNIAKVTCLSITAYYFGSAHTSIRTVGDAIQSFLEHPDESVKGLCMASGNDFSKNKPSNMDPWALVRQSINTRTSEESVGIDKRRRRWHFGAAKSRWTSIIPLWTILLGLTAGTTFLGVDLGLFALSTTGFTYLTYEVALAKAWSYSYNNVVAPTLIANCPQLVLSCLLIFYNSLLTSMLTNLEYVSYGIKRQGLRVSQPVVESCQRSTYYLQVPYRYGIPFIFLSFALHFWLSQAFYLTFVMYYYADGRVDQRSSFNAAGYSNFGLIMVTSLGMVAVIAILLLGFRRYKGLMPIGGTCSASIAAACWRPRTDQNAALGKVQWGELVDSRESFEPVHAHAHDETGLGEEAVHRPYPHLCITSADVIMPSMGISYH